MAITLPFYVAKVVSYYVELEEYTKIWYNRHMNKNEEMISFVDSNLRLEGMKLSAHEKQTMMDCLTGKTTYKKALQLALAKHRRVAA